MRGQPFDEFFRAQIGPLVTFVLRAGFSREAANDAAQEAMAKALLCWADLRDPRAWVRVVAHRIARAEAVRLKEGELRAVAGGWAESVHHDPDVAVINEEHLRLLRYLDDLPPRRRVVMAWSLDGFAPREIAELLDIPGGTVRSHLRHGRRALRAAYEREGGHGAH